MSSTDDARREALEAFWDRHMVPAAEALRARGVSFFPLGADASAETYWNARADGGDYLSALEPGDLEAALRERWAEHPELLALVGPLLELSARMAERPEESGEVSPLIYAMF
jgi:hypothetical protein